jgi:hypothetical protein
MQHKLQMIELLVYPIGYYDLKLTCAMNYISQCNLHSEKHPHLAPLFCQIQRMLKHQISILSRNRQRKKSTNICIKIPTKLPHRYVNVLRVEYSGFWLVDNGQRGQSAMEPNNYPQEIW